MEERSQGAIEYLLMLAAALAVLSGIIYLLFGASTGMGESVSSKIENAKQTVIDILT